MFIIEVLALALVGRCETALKYGYTLTHRALQLLSTIETLFREGKGKDEKASIPRRCGLTEIASSVNIYQSGRKSEVTVNSVDKIADKSRALRIVALVSPAGGAVSCPSAEIILAPSAYEAAAEILAAPTAALVVELGLVGSRHLRLLDIASSMGVEIFATGRVPAGLNADELSGVRLVSLKDLPSAIEKLLIRAEKPSPAEIRAPAHEAPEQPLPANAETTPAEASTPDQDGQYLGQVPPAERPSPPRPQEPPAAILSPEELAALLEDEP